MKSVQRVMVREQMGPTSFWAKAREIFSGTGRDVNPAMPREDQKVLYRDDDRRKRGPLSYEQWDEFFELARENGLFATDLGQDDEPIRFAGPFGLALARLRARVNDARRNGISASQFWYAFDRETEAKIAYDSSHRKPLLDAAPVTPRRGRGKVKMGAGEADDLRRYVEDTIK